MPSARLPTPGQLNLVLKELFGSILREGDRQRELLGGDFTQLPSGSRREIIDETAEPHTIETYREFRARGTAGVFNVIQGDKEAVDALQEHPKVKAISFVGSTPIARYIYRTGTANDKRVQALGAAPLFLRMHVSPGAECRQPQSPDRRIDRPPAGPTGRVNLSACECPVWVISGLH